MKPEKRVDSQQDLLRDLSRQSNLSSYIAQPEKQHGYKFVMPNILRQKLDTQQDLQLNYSSIQSSYESTDKENIPVGNSPVVSVPLSQTAQDIHLLKQKILSRKETLF